MPPTEAAVRPPSAKRYNLVPFGLESPILCVQRIEILLVCWKTARLWRKVFGGHPDGIAGRGCWLIFVPTRNPVSVPGFAPLLKVTTPVD
jgi:hypothetical protein